MPIFIKTENIKKEYLTKKTNVRKQIIHEHVEWIKELNHKGIDIKSGFLVDELKQPGAGGLLILEIDTYKNALTIIKKDPMIQNNIVDWKLSEWIDIN